jgi:hypothetical protein
VITRGDDTVIARGDDPPYPPMSARCGLIAKSAIVSGRPARTSAPGEHWYPPMSAPADLFRRMEAAS